MACLFQINTMLVPFIDVFLYLKIQRRISIHSRDMKIKEHPNLIGPEHFQVRLFQILASLCSSHGCQHASRESSQEILKIKEYSYFIDQEPFGGMYRHIWAKLVGPVSSFH